MAYEWDEEIPQPKPPTRRCELFVRYGAQQTEDQILYDSREATQTDIARALGVTEAQLKAFLADPSGHGRFAWYNQQQNLQGQQIAGLGGGYGVR